MTNEELNNVKTVLEEKLTKDYDAFFKKGMLAGWYACCESMIKEASPLTSAKAIKEMLKQKAEATYKTIQDEQNKFVENHTVNKSDSKEI